MDRLMFVSWVGRPFRAVHSAAVPPNMGNLLSYSDNPEKQPELEAGVPVRSMPGFVRARNVSDGSTVQSLTCILHEGRQ